MSGRIVEVVAGEGGDCFHYARRLSRERLERKWRIGVVMWKMRRMQTIAVDLVYFLKNSNLCHEAKIS
jgi:dihydroneopterin aldolase